MVEKRLVDYISKTLSQGYSIERVRNALLKKGWKPEDVDSALSMVASNPSVKSIPVKKVIGKKTIQKKAAKKDLNFQGSGVVQAKQPAKQISKQTKSLKNYSQKSAKSIKSTMTDEFEASQDTPLKSSPRDLNTISDSNSRSSKKTTTKPNIEKKSFKSLFKNTEPDAKYNEYDKKEKQNKKDLFKGFNFKESKSKDKNDDKKKKKKEEKSNKISSGEIKKKDGLKGLKITLVILILLFLVVLGFGIWYFFFYTSGGFLG